MQRTTQLACLAVILLSQAANGQTTTTTSAPTTKPNPWEKAIRAFEAEDAKNPPPQGEILFIGSSSIVMWNSLAQDMAPLTTIRRGFGGSAIDDAVYFAQRIIVPYKPRTIVLYSGENDLAGSKSVEEVFADFRQLVDIMHKQLPQTRMVFVSAKASIARLATQAKTRRFNAMVMDYCQGDPSVTFVDVFTPMLDATGMPRRDLLLDDKLHMNAEGYRLWTSLIKPRLRETSRLVRNLQAGKKQHLLTYGTSLTDGSSWVGDVAAELNKRFPKLLTVTNSAKGGKWSTWGLENFQALVLDKKPDTVLIEFAINDAFTPYKTTVDQARKNLNQMIDQLLKQNKDCEIILMTMNVPLREHAHARPEVDKYYQMYRQVAAERKLTLIDHHAVWNDILQTDPKLYDTLVPDGIHPAPKGNTQVVLPGVLDALLGLPTQPTTTQQAIDRFRMSMRIDEVVVRDEKTVIELPVTNVTKLPLRFVAKWHLPGQASVTPSETPAIDLKPGESTTLKFTALAPSTVQDPPVLVWTAQVAAQQYTGGMALPLRPRGLYTSDGVGDGAAKLVANTGGQVSVGAEAWKGVADCSAVATVRRTKDAFVIRVDVTDDKLVGNGEKFWEIDSVEFNFDLRAAEKRGGAHGAGCVQVAAIPHFNTSAADQVVVLPKPSGKLEGLTAKSETVKGGYWVEVTLPLRVLEASGGTVGEDFLFDFAVNDSDEAGKLKSHIRWAGGNSSFSTPQMWGLLVPAARETSAK